MSYKYPSRLIYIVILLPPHRLADLAPGSFVMSNVGVSPFGVLLPIVRNVPHALHHRFIPAWNCFSLPSVQPARRVIIPPSISRATILFQTAKKVRLVHRRQPRQSNTAYPTFKLACIAHMSLSCISCPCEPLWRWECLLSSGSHVVTELVGVGWYWRGLEEWRRSLSNLVGGKLDGANLRKRILKIGAVS